MFANDKGIANVLAILIAIAISIALSGSFIQISSNLAESMISKPNLNPYVTVTKGSIRIYNQYPLHISLKDLKLVINGNVTKIKDENGNGIWDPGEYITITLPNASVVEVELTYKNSQIYHAIFVKPEVLESDKNFPTLNVASAIVGNSMILNVTAKDDLAVKDVSIFAVNISGKKRTLSEENVIHHCHNLVAHITEFLHGRKNAELKSFEKVNLCRSFNLTELREEKVVYLLVRVTDLSGKVSQKIVLLPTSTPTIEIKPEDGSVFWTTSDKATVTFSVKAMDYYGIKYLNTSGAFSVNKTFNSRIAEINKTIVLGLGYHTLRAEATNVFGKKASAETRIRIRHDYPPSVVILQPSNNVVFKNNSVTLVAKLYDDHLLSKYEVYVNDRLTASGNASETEFTLSKVVSLQNGTNTIRVEAIDIAGQRANASVVVIVATPPTVQLIVNSTVVANVEYDVVVIASSQFGLKDVSLYVDSSKYSYNPNGAKSVRVVFSVVFTPGNHTVTAVASNDYYTSKVTKKVRAISVFLRTKIVSPRNGAQFIVGDPEFSAVAVSNFKPTITLYLDGKRLEKTEISPILTKTNFSTGWMVTPAEVYIPPIKGKNITITVAGFTGISSTERPVIRHGIADNVSFVVNRPSTVILTLYSVYGRAVGVRIPTPEYHSYTYVGGWYYTDSKAWVFVAPKGAVPDSGTITVTAYGNIPGSSYILVSNSFIPSDLSLPKNAPFAKVITVYPDRRTERGKVTVDIPKNVLNLLLSGKVHIQAIDVSRGYGWEDVDSVSTHTSVEINYHTVAKDVTVYVNGCPVKRIGRINENLVEVRLTAVQGVVTVKSNGAFSYNVLILPNSGKGNAHAIKVILPDGRILSVSAGKSVTLPFMPGLFKFEGRGLVKLEVSL